MPDIVVHASMGRRALARAGLEADQTAFAFGLLGPDPFLFHRFYVPPFRHPVNRYSSVMHRQRTGDFLLELARRASDGETLSYLYGFLCHYALDSDTHPYIIARAGGSHAAHMAIEHRLDVLDGGEIAVPALPGDGLLEAIGEAIRRVYGYRDCANLLKACHRDMLRFYRLATDESGTLDRAVGWTGVGAALSYRSRALENMDLSGFWPLYDRAVEDGARYMTAAHAFARGEIDEAKLRTIIGSRSYIEG